MALNTTGVRDSLAVATEAGLVVNLTQLTNSVEQLCAKRDAAAEALHDVGLILPNSAQQAHGWLVTRGHSYIPNTRTDTLTRWGIVAKDEGAAKLVEYRSATAQARAALDVCERAEVHGEHGIVRCRWTDAATGRIYTAQPNLQAAPLPVREAAHARGGGVFLLVDWHAAELFAIAALAEEWSLVRLISEGGDAHQHTADVLQISRELGKIVNLGLVYGLTERGMEEHTGLPIDVCKVYLREWFEAHPKIAEFREWLVLRARRTNGVRIGDIHIPIPKEKWEKDEKKAERSAVAYAGQGQIAMLMRKAIADSWARSYLRLPYHDGALYELPRSKAAHAEIVPKILAAWQLTIKGHSLKVRVSTGKTWAEAKANGGVQ